MSTLPIQVYSPQITQLGEILALDQRCLGGLWTKDNYQRELMSPNSHFLVLSLRGNQKIVGCGCFWSILDEAHLTLLMVHPDYQGQGLGQLLLCALLRNAVQCQLERATLEVSPSNLAALSLYQKFGFKLAGRRKKYYQTTGEDALILWRSDLHYPQFQQELQAWQQQVGDRLQANHWQFSIDDI